MPDDDVIIAALLLDEELGYPITEHSSDFVSMGEPDASEEEH